jgi:hypothetical protein
MSDNSSRRKGRHGPSAERDAPTDVEPLGIKKLVRIWRQLPEDDRLPFLLPLNERVGDQLFETTMPQTLNRIAT